MDTISILERELKHRKAKLNFQVHLLFAITFHPIFGVLFGIFSFDSDYHNKRDIDSDLVLCGKISSIVNIICSFIFIFLSYYLKGKENEDSYPGIINYFSNGIAISMIVLVFALSYTMGENYTNTKLDTLTFSFSIIVLIILCINLVISVIELYYKHKELKILRNQTNEISNQTDFH